MADFERFYGATRPTRDATRDRTDRDVLIEAHRFIRHEADDASSASEERDGYATPDDADAEGDAERRDRLRRRAEAADRRYARQLAKRYHDKLFTEYALADLS